MHADYTFHRIFNPLLLSFSENFLGSHRQALDVGYGKSFLQEGPVKYLTMAER